ncbi:MAG: hypothetical protein WC606_05650 [Candidatus Absconditabacterales bacterium]|jgi:hypothetical protein
MKNNEKLLDLKLTMMIIMDNFGRKLEKIYSVAFPVMAFVFSLAIGRGVFVISEWEIKLIFLLFSLAFAFVGLYLLIRRKSLLWY